jgi:hypothetical protein
MYKGSEFDSLIIWGEKGRYRSGRVKKSKDGIAASGESGSKEFGKKIPTTVGLESLRTSSGMKRHSIRQNSTAPASFGR